MFVGIPTLNRYDLLGACLERLAVGSIRPTQVCIIDNGRRWTGADQWPFPIWVVRPNRNLGVAASWNLLGRMAGRSDTVILNDDVQFAADTLLRMISRPEPFVSVSETPGFEARQDNPGVLVSDWSCFLQRRSVWDQIGEYDEGFWPAAYEDSDYWRRMSLAGLSVMRLPPDGMTHRVSATLSAFSAAERQQLDAATVRNAERYQRKWGGPPGCEKYAIAFNGMTE